MVARASTRIGGWLLAAALAGAGTAASAASPYFVNVIGTPASIACTNTGFTFGSTVTLQWQLKSDTSTIDIKVYINGAVVGTQSVAPGSTSGSVPIGTDPSPQYASTPYPYTLRIEALPQDSYTDGVQASFTCPSAAGTNWSVLALPPKVPSFSASPSPVVFPSTPVGQSAPQVVTITNTGSADATKVTIANSNNVEFPLSQNECTGPLAKGAACTLTATFRPTTAGNRTASVQVADEGGASNGVQMRGTGTGGPQLALPASVAFGNQTVGTTSAAQNVTVTNTGTSPATVASVTSSNPTEFPVTSTCSAVAAGATCTIAVTFKPAAAGTRNATVTVTSDGAGSPQAIAVTGTGTAAGGAGQLALPGPVTFAAQAVGTASAPQNATLTNVGGAPVTVTGVASSNAAEFPVTSTCATVAAGATCALSLTFTPAAAGPRSATITVTSDGTGSPQTLAVSGTGTAGPSPGQLALAADVNFGSVELGTITGAAPVAVTNIGGTAVAVASIGSSNPAEFAVASSTCGTVAAGAGCTFALTFAPASEGARTATITVVTSDGTGSPQTLAVSGTGTAGPSPGQLALAADVNFGSVELGTITGAAPVAVTNIGGTAVAVASIGSSNPAEFAVASSTCGTVAAGAGCTFALTFAPAAEGARTATITVVSNGVGSPQTMLATGTGVVGPPPPPATVDAIEYRHAEWDHYFVTSIADEIAKLDAGVFKGWARTGYKFKTHALNTAGDANVCRFFSTSFGERSSHFYTPFAGECAIVKANPDWQFEGEVFGMPIPAANGACQAGTVPVYRLYNNGQGASPNHRYTTDLAVRAQMIAQGWIPEGYGDLGVIMCAPA